MKHISTNSLKIFSIFLILIMLFSFGACSKNSDPELVLLENGNTTFSVIPSRSSDDFYKNLGRKVYNKLNNTFDAEFGLSYIPANDPDEVTTTNHEILLFDTNRIESIQAKKDLGDASFLIRATENKLVVVAKDAASSTEALRTLFNDIFSDPQYSKNGKIALPVGFEMKVNLEPLTMHDCVDAVKAGKSVCATFTDLYRYPSTSSEAPQGFATDGKYFYIAVFKRPANTRELAKIVKVDAKTLETVAVGDFLPLDHANGMTYDPVREKLIVANLYENLLTIVDPETLTVSEQLTLPYDTFSAGYIPSKNQFFFASSSTYPTCLITDENFNILKDFVRITSENVYFLQDADADDKYAYINEAPYPNTSDNIIRIYDLEKGFVGNISLLSKRESESICHIGDDFYVSFYHKGTTVSKLDFYIDFN